MQRQHFNGKQCDQFILLICLCLSFFYGVGLSFEAGPAGQSRTFEEEEKAWQKEQDEKMRAPDGWLTIAGLFWLEEGPNSFGTSSECKIQLPQDSAPAVAGSFFYRSGKVTVRAQEGVPLRVNDVLITQSSLKSDAEGGLDTVALKDLRMWIISRSGRRAVRLRDFNHSAWKNSHSLEFFAPDPKYKILADYILHEEPKTISVETEIGTTTEMVSPGYVKFALDGRELKLIGFSQGPKNLFIIFKDLTNGVETYEASRFMSAEILEGGDKVNLNFNRAYNPPCAFTPHATCPLPPPENILDVRIAAGEKRYSKELH